MRLTDPILVTDELLAEILAANICSADSIGCWAENLDCYQVDGEENGEAVTAYMCLSPYIDQASEEVALIGATLTNLSNPKPEEDLADFASKITMGLAIAATTLALF